MVPLGSKAVFLWGKAELVELSLGTDILVEDTASLGPLGQTRWQKGQIEYSRLESAMQVDEKVYSTQPSNLSKSAVVIEETKRTVWDDDGRQIEALRGRKDDSLPSS